MCTILSGRLHFVHDITLFFPFIHQCQVTVFCLSVNADIYLYSGFVIMLISAAESNPGTGRTVHYLTLSTFSVEIKESRLSDTRCCITRYFFRSFTNVRLLCFVSHSNDMTSCQSSSVENVSCNVPPFFYHHSVVIQHLVSDRRLSLISTENVDNVR
jgi:hypothetical protein